jgi:uncharacterized membrane protein
MLELLYFHSLSRAYRAADLSAVYPVARGTAPLLAVVVGLVYFREHLTTAQALGAALLIVGIWFVRPPSGGRHGLPAALLTGVLIATYTSIDSLGVRIGPFWEYAWAMFVLTSLFLMPWRGSNPLQHAMTGGAVTVAGYALVLTALSLAPLAIVAPLREAGVLLIMLWGVIRLRERSRLVSRLPGAAAVMTGTVLIALG